MSLPRHLFTPAFRYQHLGRSFAAIVGIMVFIATFATAAEAVLLTAGYLWGRTAETLLTVEIPAVGDEASTSQADRIRQALSLLRAMPEVEAVTPLSNDEVERLLSPWFNKPELLRSLPVPALIDVERKSGSVLSADKIQSILKNSISDVRVNDHGVWMQDVWRLVRGLTLLGGMTIALTAITLVIAVSLICRAVIAAERETISLLHLMGAENIDIARHFQVQASHIASRAAIAGFLIALVVTSVLFFSTQHIANLSTLGWGHWAGVVMVSLLVPFCATVIATITARLSVMRLIETFP
jgi:cell division transport system permease protein